MKRIKNIPLWIKIVVPVCIIGVFLAVWIFIEYIEPRITTDGPSDFQYIIIQDDKSKIYDYNYQIIEDRKSQIYYYIDDPRKIEAFKVAFRKVPKQGTNYYKDGADMWMTFYKDNVAVGSLPYPAGYSISQNNIVKNMLSEENIRYAYTFHVPYFIDVTELCPKIEDEQNCIATYSKHYELRNAYPTVQITYTADPPENYSPYLIPTVEVGAFSQDDYFLPWIEKLKEQDNLFDISRCSSVSMSPTEHSRRIMLYLKHSISNSEILEMRAEAEAGSDRNLGVYGSSFVYTEAKQTKIEVFFSRPQTTEDIENICMEYQMDCYQYDRKPLEIEEIVLFYKYINAPMFRSYTISSDLNVIHHEYEEKIFIPFQDATPKKTMISSAAISDDEYKYLVQIISNNDFLSLPKQIGVGGLDLKSYSYIGIKINGDWYVSGGDTPDKKNERYAIIYSALRERFELFAK